NISGEYDPENHISTNCILEELLRIREWDKLRLIEDWSQIPARKSEGVDVSEIQDIFPVSLSVDGFLDELESQIGFEDGQPSNDAGLFEDPANILPKRQDLDFTEKFWMFIKDAVNVNDIHDALVAVIDRFTLKSLQPMVHKSNHTGFANQIRNCLKLVRTKTSTDLTALKDTISGTFDYWLERPLDVIVDIGIQKLKRDYLRHLIGNNIAIWDQMEIFMDSSLPFEDQVLRLRCLHRIIELWELAHANLFSLPQDFLRTLIQSAFDFYRIRLTSPQYALRNSLSEDQLLEQGLLLWEPEDNVCFKFFLPRFANGTSKIISDCVQSVEPSLWSITLAREETNGLGAIKIDQDQQDRTKPVVAILFDKANQIFQVSNKLENDKYRDPEFEETDFELTKWRVIVASGL
ncbi:hypothetical protein HK096_005001, partial [Nowakowskiella sp. JEL0078]